MRGGLGHAFVDHDHAGPDPDLEAIVFGQRVQRLLVHEEHRVAELLRPSLQPVRGSGGAVVTCRLAAAKENAFTILATDHQAGFGDPGKHQHGNRLPVEFPCRRHRGHQLAISLSGTAIDRRRSLRSNRRHRGAGQEHGRRQRGRINRESSVHDFSKFTTRITERKPSDTV